MVNVSFTPCREGDVHAHAHAHTDTKENMNT